MLRKLILGFGLLALTGCFEAETGLTFKADETVDGFSRYAIDQQFYQMAGARGGFCPDGEIVEEATQVACLTEETLTLDEALQRAADQDAVTLENPEAPQFKMEKVGDNEIIVVMPLGELAQEIGAGAGADAADMNAMMTMMGSSFEGKNLKFWIEAPEILESSEEITNDGTRTEIVLAVEDLMAGNISADRDFIVRLKY